MRRFRDLVYCSVWICAVYLFCSLATVAAAAPSKSEPPTDAPADPERELIIPFTRSRTELVIHARPKALAWAGWDLRRFRQECISALNLPVDFVTVLEEVPPKDPARLMLSVYNDVSNTRKFVPLTGLADVQMRPMTYVSLENLGPIIDLMKAKTELTQHRPDIDPRDPVLLKPLIEASEAMRKLHLAPFVDWVERRQKDDFLALATAQPEDAFRLLRGRAKAAVPRLVADLPRAKGTAYSIAIISALELIGPDAAGALPEIEKHMESASGGIWMLAAFGDEALPFLDRQTRTAKGEWKRSDAARAMALLGPTGVKALRAAAEDADEKVRFAVAEGLGALGDTSGRPMTDLPVAQQQELATILIPLLNDVSPRVRTAAAPGIPAASRDERTSAVPALMKMLDEPEVRTQDIALDVLVKLDVEPTMLIPKVRQMLRRKGRQDIALRQVKLIGRAAGDLVPEVMLLLEGHPDQVKSALETLAAIGGPSNAAALPKVIKLTRDADPYIALSAVKTIATTGPEAAPAVDVLRTGLRGMPVKFDQPEFQFYYQDAVIKALGTIGAPARGALPDMLKVMNEGNHVRVAQAMAAIDRDRTIDLFGSDWKTPSVRFSGDYRGEARRWVMQLKLDEYLIRRALNAGVELDTTARVSDPNVEPDRWIGRDGNQDWGELQTRAATLRAGDRLSRVLAMLRQLAMVRRDGSLEYREVLRFGARPAPRRRLLVRLEKGLFKSVEPLDPLPALPQ